MIYLLLGAILSALPVYFVLKYKNDNKYIWIILAMLFNSLLILVYIQVMKTNSSRSGQGTTQYTLIKILSIITVAIFCSIIYKEQMKWLGLICGLITIYLMS
jgi:hypothetical protein